MPDSECAVVQGGGQPFWEGPQAEACRLAQKIKKGAAAKPGDLSLLLRTHMVQGEN